VAPWCGLEIRAPRAVLLGLHSRHAERAPHREDGRGEIAHDEFGLEPNYEVAGARELSISAGIRGHAPCVIAAIDLDDEACARRVEVSDEAEQGDLPPERDAELA